MKDNCALCKRDFSFTNSKFLTKECTICQKCVDLITGSVFKDEQIKVKSYSKKRLKSMLKENLNARGVTTNLLDKKNKECPICYKKISKLKPTYKTLESYKICFDHYQKVAPMGILTIPYSLYQINVLAGNIEDTEKEKKERINNFKYDINLNNAFFINSENKKFGLLDYPTTGNIYNLDDIKGFEIIENNNTVTSGGLGRAVAGAITFGGAGAIVGAITGKKTNNVIESLKVKIILNSLETPILYVNLINNKINVSDKKYNESIQIADEIISGLDTVLNKYSKDKEEEEKNNDDIVSKIKEYKDLLDENVITNDEFKKLKDKLLS